jgi:predicted glutamine amidotransferase
MCRALIYLGQPVLLDHLLFQPDSSLVKQSFMPRKLHMLNLAGFGMVAWDSASRRPEEPFRYHSTSLPIFDRNLKALAEKIAPSCVVAHIRGVRYSTEAEISLQNTHPFRYPGARIAMAHNGDLHRIAEMRGDLLRHMRADIAGRIAGTTDSEIVYALLLSQLREPFGPIDQDDLAAAVPRTLDIIARARAAHGIDISSSLNLFFGDGEAAGAIRYCFDYGCYRTDDPARVHEANLGFLSLWYTCGRSFGLHEGEWKMIGDGYSADSVLIASEPLTLDATSWLEVPEYSMMLASVRDGRPMIEVTALDL